MARICSRCCRTIADGAPAFRLILEVVADYDGFVQPMDTNSIDALIKKIIIALEKQNAGEIEKNIFERRHFTLCPTCRDSFMANPLHLPIDLDIQDSLPYE